MVNEQHKIAKSFKSDYSRLLGFIRSQIGSLEESEDLLQEVYAQALSRLNVLDAVDNLSGWLFTITKNKVIDWYRKKKALTVSIESTDENGLSLKDILAEEIPDSPDETTQELVYDEIIHSIDELPENQKYVFIQQVIEGRTFSELSEETGVSINTLIARKRYAIQFLRNRLKEIRKPIND